MADNVAMTGPTETQERQDHDALQALSAVDWPVRTERLRLRPATPADVEATWAFRRLPEVCEWLTRADATVEEYAERFLSPERLASTLVIELDGRVVGDLMFTLGDAWAQAEVADRAARSQVELGWVIDPAYAGRGIATEAVRALLRIAFEEVGLRRATALCFADNVASWRLMEKVGMRREEHTRSESLHRTRGWLDGFGYAILADEWADRRRAEAGRP